MQAVQADGKHLEYASRAFRRDREIVMVAARQNPRSLNFALDGLNQDHECLGAAGIWAESLEQRDTDLAKKDPRKGIYSVKFCTSFATDATAIMKRHEYVGTFDVYFPSAFNKRSCDPHFITFSWPCRGTTATCCMEPESLRSGKPDNNSCWRYSFRNHQEICANSGGFMLQLEEREDDMNDAPFALGAGQIIETDMAKQAGLKIFRIQQGTKKWHKRRDFNEEDANMVAEAIKSWSDAGGSATDCAEQIVVLRKTNAN